MVNRLYDKDNLPLEQTQLLPVPRPASNLFVSCCRYLITKLLQKSEMQKDIVIELSYKGFS